MNIEVIVKIFACVSFIIGAIECFAGYKILKVMMIIWAFFIGSMFGVWVGVLSESIVLGFISIIVFGVILAVLAFRYHIAGVFILTGFLTAIALYLIFQNIILAIVIGVLIGIVAILFLKPVIIYITAISGAGIILESAYVMIMGLNVNVSPIITAIVWVPVSIVGIMVQNITTKRIKEKRKSSKSDNPSQTFSERKYPGMQRAYRNYCIKCGAEIVNTPENCPRCGYTYKNSDAK